jgi:DNA (cytosine-5)-methyltransferase 1
VNDFDKDACETYKNYYKINPVCKDIKNVDFIPECDIITGGFPCQGFSVANIHRNEKDERNELYKELVRLIKLRPSFLLFLPISF